MRRGALWIVLVAGLWAAAQVAPDYAARGRATVAAMAAGKFAAVESGYSAKMAAALPAGRLADIWKQVQAQVGAYQEVEKASVVEAGGLHTAVLACRFAKATLNVVLAFDGDGRIAGLRFAPAAVPSASGWAPPAYAHPAAFHEEQVRVGTAPWTLPGTLTLPSGAGPFPAVVLVPGSGPEDGDETIGPNKPFKDLAWGLASRGIAVLRYVKRTRQYGGRFAGHLEGYTVKQGTVDDARAAVALLSQRADIQPRAIYLLGHSEGGYLAPRIAQRDASIAGIISLAGSTRPLLASVLDQYRYFEGLKPSAGLEQEIQATEKAQALANSPALKATDAVAVAGTALPGSYFLDLRGYDPGATAAGLKIPILVLQGGRDYQVTLKDFDGWKQALGKDPRAAFQYFPDLDHLLGVGGTPPSPADYARPGHVAEPVIEAIANWMGAKG